MRQDSDLISKIEEINEKFQSLSSKHGVTFISNMSVDETCLNSSGLHLNAKGTAILATHFIKFLRDGQSLSSLRPQKHSRQDFPKNTINHLHGRTTKCDNELEQINCQDVPSNSLLGIDSEINIIAKSKGLKIANLNVNSLMKHLDEIRLILNNNALDILAINESKIDNQISNNEIHIDGFNIIRKDRNRFGGCVVLYVRQNISFSDRIDLIPDELETVCIELSLPYNKSLLISININIIKFILRILACRYVHMRIT